MYPRLESCTRSYVLELDSKATSADVDELCGIIEESVDSKVYHRYYTVIKGFAAEVSNTTA